MAFKDDKTLPELFAELSHETQQLLYQMMELAKAEMAEKASLASRDMLLMAAGGALAYAGVLVLAATLVIILAYAMPLWIAALIVGVLVMLVGIILIQEGRKDLKRKGLVPQRTVAEIKEETQWAKRQMM